MMSFCSWVTSFCRVVSSAATSTVGYNKGIKCGDRIIVRYPKNDGMQQKNDVRQLPKQTYMQNALLHDSATRVQLHLQVAHPMSMSAMPMSMPNSVSMPVSVSAMDALRVCLAGGGELLSRYHACHAGHSALAERCGGLRASEPACHFGRCDNGSICS